MGMTTDPKPPADYEATPGHHTEALTVFRGPYINLTFQDGPIREHGENGTTNEAVIQLLIDRIDSLNTMEKSRYHCIENDLALDMLREAKYQLEQRTRSRVARGVEGTHTP